MGFVLWGAGYEVRGTGFYVRDYGAEGIELRAERKKTGTNVWHWIRIFSICILTPDTRNLNIVI